MFLCFYAVLQCAYSRRTFLITHFFKNSNVLFKITPQNTSFTEKNACDKICEKLMPSKSDAPAVPISVIIPAIIKRLKMFFIVFLPFVLFLVYKSIIKFYLSKKPYNKTFAKLNIM